MPILLGREVYGFPKRMGRIRLGERRVDLLVDKAVQLHARWAQETAVAMGGFVEAFMRAMVPAGPARAPIARVLGGLVGLAERAGMEAPEMRARVFARKRIRAPHSFDVDSYAIDELVEVPFELLHLGNLGRLDGAHVEAATHSRVFPTTTRLAPDGSGFDNLYLAGDWTRTSINGGSVEAAAESGQLAANAIAGRYG